MRRQLVLLAALILFVAYFISSFLLRGDPPSASPLMESKQAIPVTVLTYNIHSCVGSDAVYSVERIVAVLREANADIVCLQEVQVNDKSIQTTRLWSKPHQDDQVAIIAAQAGYSYSKFAPAIRSIANHHDGTEVFLPFDSSQGGMFGVALLSKWPIINSKVLRFAPYAQKTPRNALVCQIEIPTTCASATTSSDNDDCADTTKTIWVISTHLGMHPPGGEQLQQAKELRLFIENLLLSPQQQHSNSNNKTNTKIILAGDFNSPRWFPSIKELKRVLAEANRHNHGTFPATGLFSGSLKLDYIFHNVVCTDTQVQLNGAVASDHLAFYGSLLVCLSWCESVYDNTIYILELQIWQS